MDNIERKLESTFGKRNDLDNRLKSASSSVLTQRIEFQESSRPHSSMNDMLKDKYVKLASGASSPMVVKKSSSSLGLSTVDHDGEGLPHPKVTLFQEPLSFTWDHPRGTGFINCGNTCFLNAVLQCLIHTPPLTNYMMSSHHTKQCQMQHRDRCILCNLEYLTQRSLSASLDAITPKWFTNNLQSIMEESPLYQLREEKRRNIGRHFRNGRQEDAHEFLRLSLEKMQKCALYGNGHLDKYSKETTVVNKIFGGFLRSQVQCVKCNHKSNTYDPLLDISLDIRAASTLQQALNQFVAPDKLEAENAYKCERCKQKVTAFKRFTIHKAPNVLTIQLKRFQYGSGGFFGGGGSKIHKAIQYPLKFNLRGFMSNRNGPPLIYTLIGSIQHEGYTCTSGHYVANVRCGDKWYNFNDSNGRLRHVNHCLNEDSAYILFYMLETNQQPRIGPELKPQTISQNNEESREGDKKKKNHSETNGNSLPQTSTSQHDGTAFSKPFKPVNGTAPYTSPKTPYVQASPKVNGFPTNDIGEKVKSPFVPLPANREKIRINLGIKTKSPEKPKPVSSKTPVRTQSSSPSKSETSTPRIVMKIKDGRSITIETSPDGERRILSDDDEVIAMMNEKKKKYTKRLSIVPYGDDSDSEWSSTESSPKLSSNDAKKDHSKENGHGKNGVVLDGSLNTTTSVPGNAHLFNTVTLKDKVSHTHSRYEERPKDMKFTPKAGHPVKRQLSDSLSCSTSPVPAKHSGTGEWHTSAESVLSPSIGSNHSHGSNHSNSSTHDWSVLKNKDRLSTPCVERKNDGWTVTQTCKESGKHVSEENKNMQSMDKKVVNIVENEYSSPYLDVSDRLCLLKREKPKDKNSEEYKEYKRLKKLKKRHKRRHHEVEHNYSGVSEEVSRHSHKKKKRKHKSKHREREDEHQGKHRYEDTDRDSQRHKYRDEERKYRDDVHENAHIDKHRDKDRDDESHRHKHRDDGTGERDLKRRHEKETNDESRKRGRQSSESSLEFEWVEKTVDNPVPARASMSEPVTPTHRWDHHIKDGHKRKSTSGSSTPVVTTWDGLKHSKVVQELEKVSSYSYGAPVSGWDGEISQLDADREFSGKRKDSDDDYDDEYDRGKVKKVKHQHHNEHRHNGNVFQQKQDQINRSKIKWTSIKVGDNNPFKAGQAVAHHSSHTKF